MYACKNNLPYLKLEMKGHMTLSAHKFILCAWSQVSKELIMTEMEKDEFDGTRKISEVNARPKVVILHWMYTGKLQENVGNFMMEIVEAAIHFRLTGMMKILYTKLISICTEDNMFNLHNVAEKDALPTAKAQLSQFIKDKIA